APERNRERSIGLQVVAWNVGFMERTPSASRWIAVDGYVGMHLHSGAGEQWHFKMTQPVLLSACLVQGNQHCKPSALASS
ncbi:hypothetical protein SHV74_17720, partial [Pseudomonas capeferrum]|uniref:hypothetical protein n=1 Tax=Pseudomonas capeferrum TaxID=1495066 RepID=UPI00397D56A7